MGLKSCSITLPVSAPAPLLHCIHTHAHIVHVPVLQSCTHPHANQVNAHIMLLHTTQRCHHAVLVMAMAVAPCAEDGHDCKRLHVEGSGAVHMDDVGVRRLKVMFNSVCALNGGNAGLWRFFLSMYMWLWSPVVLLSLKHNPTPDESKRGALGSAFDATKDARLVCIQELAGLHVCRLAVPSVCHMVERDSGKLVRRCESVEMRSDGREVARGLKEHHCRCLPTFFVIVKELGD